MRKLILIVISAFALLSSPAIAKDAGSATWIVSQLSGDARVVHAGLQPASLKVQSRLNPGDTVVTGLTGRATLTRGADYIIIAPRSELQLPSTPEPSGFTRVIQNLGTMLFKVRHTGIPHFSVDTPMLAAVVKGTTFSVIVDKDRSAVQVIQGAVQVTAIEGGMSRLVEGGKTVFIDRASPKRLMDADEHSPASSSTTGVKLNGSQTPSVAAIANLTEGLIHPGAATPTTATASKPSSATDTAAASTAQSTVDFANATVAGTTSTLTGLTDTATDIVGNTTLPTDVVDTATDLIDTTVPGVTDTTTDVVDTATDVIDTTVPGVTDTVTDVVDTVTDVIDTTVPGVTDTITDVVDTATDVIDTTVPDVTDTVTDVVGGVIDIVDNSGPGSDNSGPGSDNSGPGSDNSGPGSITDIVDTTVAGTTDVVDTVTDVVDTTVPTVTQTVTTTVDSLLGGLFHH